MDKQQSPKDAQTKNQGNIVVEAQATPSKGANAVVTFIIGFIIGGLTVMMFTSDGSTSPVVEDEVVEDDVMVTEDGDDVMSEDTDPGTTMTEDNSAMMEEDTTPEPVVADPTENKVTVSDQLAGEIVSFDSVSLLQSSWVVVHEEQNGVLGNALGAKRLNAGTHAAGTITLVRETTVDQTYHVLMYQDDGDREFSLNKDQLLVDNEGNALDVTFTTMRPDRKI